MGPLDDVNSIERQLCDIADYHHEPIGGTFELLPLCNMNCKMCYVRMTPDEMKKKGRMLSLEEWTEIGRQAVDKGLLFLLITGGEPMLFPHFPELYHRLHDMGIVISVNSNGTLITEEIARELGRNLPRRMNITIYGASDETYGRLCQNPHGFTQMTRALDLCEQYGVPYKMNFSATPYNVGELDAIYEIADKRGVKLDVAPYMFPPVRKFDKVLDEGARLAPAEAAALYVRHLIRTEGEELFAARMERAEAYYLEHEEAAAAGQPIVHPDRIPCRAGSSTFWINWQGQMTNCGMFENPSFSVLERGFEDCWASMREFIQGEHVAEKCANCSKKGYCIVCAASAMAETGRVDGVSEYHCQMADEVRRLGACWRTKK